MVSVMLGARVDRPTRDFAARGGRCGHDRAGSSARVAAEPRISDVLCRHHSLGRRISERCERWGPLPGPKWLKPGRRRGDVLGHCRPCDGPHRCRAFQYDVALRLLANLLSVPVMGLFVVPSAVVAALLAPFGLEAMALTMSWDGHCVDPYGFRLGVAPWMARRGLWSARLGLSCHWCIRCLVDGLVAGTQRDGPEQCPWLPWHFCCGTRVTT